MLAAPATLGLMLPVVVDPEAVAVAELREAEAMPELLEVVLATLGFMLEVDAEPEAVAELREAEAMA